MAASWEHFEHGADMGIRGFGPTLADAFAQAALALTAAIVDPRIVESRESVDIQCDAPDTELLLVVWLNELVYEMSSRRMLFGRFDVQVEGGRLHARVWGEPVDRARHRPAVEVKGATCTALRVGRDDGRWLAQTVVDV
jgi:tRNA nucleotidyltransferase (CCA-adding enzyme)